MAQRATHRGAHQTKDYKRLIDVVFYFDFGSPRAYLLAAQLGEWMGRLPVRLRPYPVDSGVMGAMSGEPAVRHAEAGMKYLRMDAERWAAKLGVGLDWGSEPVKSGLALRVCLQLQESHPALVWPMVRAAFERAWSGPGGLSEGHLRVLLSALQLGDDAAEQVLRAAASAEAFGELEDHTKRAVRMGLFDVPTLRVGDALFVGHDRLEMAGEAVLEAVLGVADVTKLRHQLSALLLELTDERRRRFLEQVAPVVVQGQDAAHKTAAQITAAENEEHRLLLALESLAHLLSSHGGAAAINERGGERANGPQAGDAPPAQGLSVGVLVSRRDVPIHLISTLMPTAAGGNGHGNSAMLLAPASVLIAYDVGVSLGPWGGPGGLLARAQTPQSQSRALVCAPGEQAWVLSQDPSEAGDLKGGVGEVGDWRVSVLDGARAKDQALCKAAAVSGAHLLVLYGIDDLDPRPIAAARATGRWVLTCDDNTLRLCDAQGHWLEWPLRAGFEEGLPTLHLTWPPILPPGQTVNVWEPPEARSVLLNEVPISLGAMGSDAELILACRGHSLRLETANMRCTLSPGRPFEIIRLEAGPLVVLPFFGDQLRAYDLIAERLLKALCRAPQEGCLLLVSYWPDTDAASVAAFSLDMAAAAVAHQVPVAVVVGERVVDLWHPEQDEPCAYRIEPEGDSFQFNATLQPTLRARQKQLIDHLGASPLRYLNMLSLCAASPHPPDISRLAVH